MSSAFAVFDHSLSYPFYLAPALPRSLRMPCFFTLRLRPADAGDLPPSLCAVPRSRAPPNARRHPDADGRTGRRSCLSITTSAAYHSNIASIVCDHMNERFGLSSHKIIDLLELACRKPSTTRSSMATLPSTAGSIRPKASMPIAC